MHDLSKRLKLKSEKFVVAGLNNFVVVIIVDKLIKIVAF